MRPAARVIGWIGTIGRIWVATACLWVYGLPGTSAQALSLALSNTPPVLSPIGDNTVAVGSVFAFTITASDADGDPLTISSRNLPPGATLTVVSGPTSADSTPPSVPSKLVVTNSASSSISLQWVAAQDPESGLQRYVISRNGSAIGQTSDTSFTDSGLLPSTKYLYGVVAVNGAGLSSTRASVMATTLAGSGQTGPGVTVAIRLDQTAQRIQGMGGNYPDSRMGWIPQDAVGQLLLDTLKPTQVRIGLPMMKWEPTNDNADPMTINWSGLRDQGTVHELFQLLQDFHARQIPIVASIWDLPDWMVADASKSKHRTIGAGQMDEVVESILAFLQRAQDVYGVPIAYVSFNEADLGINVDLTPADYADLIQRAGRRFDAAGLSTKWLGGDTASAMTTVNYTRPLLDNPAVSPYIGPIAYHSYSGTDDDFRAIAALAEQYGRDVWATEVGYHPNLSSFAVDPRATWQHALNTAVIYDRVLTQSHATVLDHWHYQGDGPYALVNKTSLTPYPIYYVIKQFMDHLPVGCQMVQATANAIGVRPIAAVDDANSRFTMLLINTQPSPVPVTVTGLPNTVLTAERTSASEDLADIGTYQVVNGRLQLSLPKQSVTSFSGALDGGASAPAPSPGPGGAPSTIQATLTWVPGTGQAGVYPIHIEVSDGSMMDSQDLTLTVVADSNPQDVVAKAGSDRTVVSGTPVTLNGSQSLNPSGGPLTYDWMQVNGPNVTMKGVHTAWPSFTAPTVTASTDLVFSLTVSDGVSTSTDYVMVTVTPDVQLPPPPAVEQHPWQSAASGVVMSGGSDPVAAGYHFITNADGYVTALGGLFNGTKVVKLFNRGTGQLLASATVTSANSWSYTPIPPVKISVGATYTVAVYLQGSGGTQRVGVKLPQVVGNIKIKGGTLAAMGSRPDARPYTLITDKMYGQADIAFVPQ